MPSSGSVGCGQSLIAMLSLTLSPACVLRMNIKFPVAQQVACVPAHCSHRAVFHSYYSNEMTASMHAGQRRFMTTTEGVATLRLPLLGFHAGPDACTPSPFCVAKPCTPAQRPCCCLHDLPCSAGCARSEQHSYCALWAHTPCAAATGEQGMRCAPATG